MMTSDTRSPEEIEREIERERAGLSSTLDDLQNRFSVETIARQFTDQFREHGGDIGRSVSDAVKRNPVALALTGVGLAWLMMGDKSGGQNHSTSVRRVRHVDYGHQHDDDQMDMDHDGRMDSSRSYGASNSSQHRAQSLGPQPGNPNKPYYSGRNNDYQNTPSWARVDHDDDHEGMGSRLRGAASGAGSSISGAASSAGSSISGAASATADSARNAGSAVAGTAKGAASSVSQTGKSIADGARNMANDASQRAAAWRDRLAEGTENLTEEARNRVVAARESAVEARRAAASYTRQGRDRAVDIFEEQPLIAGALAVALGAALGAALPRSRMEDEYMGEHSDHLMHEAERIFDEEKAKLGKVAQAAKDEANKIAREAKQNADDAAPADTAAQAVMDKAKASGKRIADAAEAEAEKQNVGDIKKS